MDRFLSDLQSEGILDSNGAFTVDFRQARLKMSGYQLPDPAAYVLKLVQAAVASGAQSLTVSSDRASLTMAFPACNEEMADPAIVGGAVLRVSSLPRCPLRHLAVALNAASAAELQEILWQTPRGTLSVTREALSASQETSNDLRLVVRRKRSLLSWFRGTPFVEELHLLGQRCRYAPLDLRIDGRDIERPLWCRFEREVEDSLGLPARCLLLEQLLAGKGLRIVFPQGAYRDLNEERKVWDPQHTLEKGTLRTLLVDGWNGETPRAASCVIGLSSAAVGHAYWQAVVDGVELKPVGTSDLNHPGALVVFDASDLETDFSEFRLVRDDRLAARLAGLGDCVLRACRSVGKDDLRSALQAIGMSEPAAERFAGRAVELLSHHGMASPTTVAELARLSFRQLPNVSFAPLIPDTKLRKALSVHSQHLQPDEEVIALFDDTMLGSGKDGFLITDRRLCWKRMLDSPGYVLWEELPWLELHLRDGIPHLRNCAVSVSLQQEICAATYDFLSQVGSVAPEPPGLSPNQREDREHRPVLRAALQTLGKDPKLAYHPYISPKWRAQIKKTYGAIWTAGGEPLVCYDDTLLGKADQGWVATQDHLYWRYLASKPRCLAWSEVRLDEIHLAATGVRIGKHELYMHRSELREGAAAFISAMVR